jgi:hypothetical protein
MLHESGTMANPATMHNSVIVDFASPACLQYAAVRVQKELEKLCGPAPPSLETGAAQADPFAEGNHGRTCAWPVHGAPLMPRPRGGNRTVVQLSDENFIAVEMAISKGGERPEFGSRSRLLNAILDDWRARNALKETQNDRLQSHA